MSDREKLIEEAAKAMADGEHNVLGWRGHSEDEQDWYRKDAAIALSVFEKAHTPTDDEREALAQAIRDALGVTPETIAAGHQRPGNTDDLARDLIARGFGFRRSEEPSAECPKCGVSVTDQTPSTFYPHHDETCGGPLDEPQGEPSDAQVKAFEDEWYRLDYVTEPERHRRALAAALRAAGEVS